MDYLDVTEGEEDSLDEGTPLPSEEPAMVPPSNGSNLGNLGNPDILQEVHAICAAPAATLDMDYLSNHLQYLVSTTHKLVLAAAEQDRDELSVSSQCDVSSTTESKMSKPQILLENWDYDTCYEPHPDCNPCYPCSIFSREVINTNSIPALSFPVR
eukprot:sb/3473168/